MPEKYQEATAAERNQQDWQWQGHVKGLEEKQTAAALEEEDQIEQKQQELEQEHNAPVALDDKNHTDYSKKYNEDEAKSASLGLALFIEDKIKAGDNTTTPITNIIEQNHVIRTLKEKGIKVNITFNSDFANEEKKLSQNTDKDIILREFITDVSNANKITFNSKASKKQFLNTANRLGLEIDENTKIEVSNSCLSGSQEERQEERQELGDLTEPLNSGQKQELKTSTNRPDPEGQYQTQRKYNNRL